MNEVPGRKRSSCNQIRVINPEERIKLWKEHFENLLGQPSVPGRQPVTKVDDVVRIETGDFMILERQEAIKATQNNKATGYDDIPAEVWKLYCLS